MRVEKSSGWSAGFSVFSFIQGKAMANDAANPSQTLLLWCYTVWGMSLRNVSYKTFDSSAFSRNQEKTKPLTWLSVRSLVQSSAAPNLTASRHNLVAIQLSIKTSFTWQFESPCLTFNHFRLAQVTRLRQMFEMSHARLKQWQAQLVLHCSISFIQGSIWKASTLSFCPAASLSQHPRNSDVFKL